MHAAIADPGNSRTILTHVFGRGLDDERYVVERFQAMANGDIRRWPGDEPAKKGRRKAKRTIAWLKAVQEMRPAPTEIIICTGLRIKGGVQYWGAIATVEVPDAARAVVVSLDGVMAPMRGGYREAGCATVSLVDGDGERLHSVRMGRMPESHKATLKTMVAAEVEAVLGQRPDLTVVKLADGTKDNWTFLARALPGGVELIDFYHAVEKLKDAFDTAHGADSPKAAAQFEKYRHLLRHEPDGVERVIRALVYLRSKHPTRGRIAQVLGYFRGNRHRMRYADAKAQELPIGSGIVEAACKTLVTERLKRSDMRWGPRGGQAILTLRSLVQSRRFDLAWSLLAQSYRTQVSCPDNVVPLRRAKFH